MKKILIFNGYYFPSKNCGGPITSVENIVNALYKEFEFYIICYNHDFGNNYEFNLPINEWLSIGNAKVMYVKSGNLDFSIDRTRKLFETLKPDLIWFSGILTPNNKIVTAINAKKMGIPVLFSPRGELSADRVCIKGYKKIPYLKIIKLLGIYAGCFFHATSKDEEEGIKRFFNPDSKHLFKVANIAILQQKDVIKYYKEKNKLRILFFSRIHEVKNVLYAIKCAKNCRYNIEFNIYGPIESKTYWNECLKEIKTSPDNVTINYCGILEHDKMSAVVQSHDCMLFPTINENYGHVIAETLANGRPVILSKGTTPWDDIDNIAGFTNELDKPEDFTRSINKLAMLNNDEYIELINSTKNYFNKKVTEDSSILGHKRMINSIVDYD